MYKRNNLTLLENKSSSYAPRTYHNATQGVTLAIAIDHNTAGEKCTQKAAGDKILKVHWKDALHFEDVASLLSAQMQIHCTHTVNVAGNGIYTFNQHHVEQVHVNQYVYDILRECTNNYHVIEKIVSGGQTGADIAGLVAGVILDIPTEAMFPKGYKMRFKDMKDVDNNPEQIADWIYKFADRVIK